jgi:hypothetical protein
MRPLNDFLFFEDEFTDFLLDNATWYKNLETQEYFDDNKIPWPVIESMGESLTGKHY